MKSNRELAKDIILAYLDMAIYTGNNEAIRSKLSILVDEADKNNEVLNEHIKAVANIFNNAIKEMEN